MNTNFEVIGLTRLGMKPKSTAPDADALTTQPSELLSGTHAFNCFVKKLLWATFYGNLLLFKWIWAINHQKNLATLTQSSDSAYQRSISYSKLQCSRCSGYCLRGSPL